MKLFIATPTLKGTTPLYSQSLIRLMAERPVEFTYRQVVGISLGPGFAKTAAAHEFLKTDCTDYLQIDDDIGFTPRDVARIVTLQPPRPGSG